MANCARAKRAGASDGNVGSGTGAGSGLRRNGREDCARAFSNLAEGLFQSIRMQLSVPRTKPFRCGAGRTWTASISR